MSHKPLILISNDDGIFARGIIALAEAVGEVAEIVVVAPETEKSGASHGITLSQPLRIKEIRKNWYSVNGSPADCVLVGLKKILNRQPDWVISGINRGANLGQDTLYSGTVAAAMESVVNGVPAIAMSLVLKPGSSENYTNSQKVLKALLADTKLSDKLDGGVLNVNIPDVEESELGTFEVATLGKRIYDGRLVERTDPRGHIYYWIGGGGLEHELIDGSDCEVVKNNNISLTVLQQNHSNLIANQQIQSHSLDIINKKL